MEDKIKKGVRQLCVLSPIILNIYIDEATNECKDKIDTGIKIQGQKIAKVRFAEDIALLRIGECSKRNQPNLVDGIKMKINKRSFFYPCTSNGNMCDEIMYLERFFKFQVCRKQ